jgi:hypothetical protein
MIAAKPGELVVGVDRPLAGAAVVLDERAVAFQRGRVEAVEVELRDLDHPVGLGEGGIEVAPLVDALPGEIRARLVVEDRCVVAERLAGVGHRRQRLVVHLDELGGVARGLTRGRDDRGDRLADEAGLADREAEVAKVRPGRRGDLEEGVGQEGDLVPGQRPEHARVLERLRDVDRAELRVRVGRADEVDVAHVVAPDVVHEHALALDEPPVLLARNALACVARLGLGLLDDDRLGDGVGHETSWPDAALIALTMFQ